jgi:putative membrane protein
MFDLLIYALLGIVLGTVTGLVPGLHVNAVSFFILTLPLAGNMNIVVALTTLSITHSFLDFIPSIYLGAPDSSSENILPGHKMLLEGKGLEALMLTAVGGVLGLLFLFASIPLIVKFIPLLYSGIKIYLASILLGFSAFMILSERKVLSAIFVFISSGILGLLVINYPISLFTCLTGFFGISTMAFSAISSSRTPRQTEYRIRVGIKESIFGGFVGYLSGVFLSMLPAMGASQASVISQKITKGNERTFLVTHGAINSVVTLASVIALFLISRSRSGVAVAVEQVLGGLNYNNALLIIGFGLVSAGVSVFLAVFFGVKFARLIRKVDYRKISVIIITLLLLEVGFGTGSFGILLLCVSSAIGIVAQTTGIKRSNCMGFLLVPTTLLYLF